MSFSVLSVPSVTSPIQQPPVYRGGTTVVEVPVIVRGTNGAFVPGLTVEDFELLENGRPQRIETLYIVTRPGAKPDSARDAAASHTRTAERTFLFLFDMPHLSPGSLMRARDAVRAFASQRLLETDLSGAAAVGGTVQGQIAADREALVARVNQLKPRADAVARERELKTWPRIASALEAQQIAANDESVLQRARDRNCEEVQLPCTEKPGGAGAAPPKEGLGAFEIEANREQVETDLRRKAQEFVRESRASARGSLSALEQTARLLAELPGRKTVVWLTEGTFSDEAAEQARTTVLRAAESGVSIYTIDPRGLGRRGGSADDMFPHQVGTDVLRGGEDDIPNYLAAGTGGLAIRNENRLDRALRTIEDDTSTYYVLGYAAAESRDDGGYRNLTVRVRRSGVWVRARHGYLAPRASNALAPSAPAYNSPPVVPLGESLLPANLPAPEVPAPLSPAVAAASPARTTGGSAVGYRLRPGAAEHVAALSGGTGAVDAEAAKGWSAYERGDVEGAIGPLTRAAAQPDARAWVFYALGLSQAALGRREDAIRAWERVRQIAPEFPQVYLDLAATYVQGHELTKALAVLREAEKRWPRNQEVHNGIGVIHARRGALDEAIDAFTEAVEAAPGEALSHLNLGNAYAMRYHRDRRYVASQRIWIAPRSREGDRLKALEHLRRCVEIGGPYASHAAEAASLLEWSKQE